MIDGQTGEPLPNFPVSWQWNEGSHEKLDLTLAELKDVKTRLTALEAIAKDRSRYKPCS
jgi:hypothetical protein